MSEKNKKPDKWFKLQLAESSLKIDSIAHAPERSNFLTSCLLH